MSFSAARRLLGSRRRQVAAALLVTAPLAVVSDEGLSRSLYFNYHALPALVHYRVVEWGLRRRGASEAETAARLQPLHEKYAPVALRVILNLRGFYIKARSTTPYSGRGGRGTAPAPRVSF